MLYLLYGLFIGFWIGITIGPIGILCLRRSMAVGAWAGLATGIGASLSHLVFGAIAVFGLQFVESFFNVYGGYIRLVGSLFILYIAARIARNPISLDGTDTKLASNGTAFLSAILINFSNPISIASYVAFISILNLKIDSFMTATWFLSGIFIGNLAWWILLSTTSTYIKPFLNKKHLRYINIIVACLLAGLAFIGIGTALISFMR